MGRINIESPGSYDARLALAMHKLANKPRGCMVTLTAAITAQNYTSFGTMIPWDSEVYDTDGCHDNVSNNTRLTVPSGWSYARIAAMIECANVGAGSWQLVTPRLNGSSITFGGGLVAYSTRGTGTASYHNFRSGLISVSPGDYFEIGMTVNSDNSVDVQANSWFALELVA